MIAQIETNTFCNHKCWYCQNAHYTNPEPQVMAMRLFEAILIKISTSFTLPQLSTISFAAYNEPTLDPYFRDRLRLLDRYGFSYWFITNGSKLTPDLVDFIMRKKPAINCYHINLPAIDPDEYNQATAAPAQSIFQIRENLAYFFKKLGGIGPPITIIVHGKGDAIHEHNFKRMNEFWKDYPIEVNFQGVMNRGGMLNHILGLPIDHKTDIVWCTAKYFENLYIGVNGNIYLCCHDYYQQYSFGNIADEPLEVLHTSIKRTAMLRNFTHDFCRHCSFAVKLEDIQSGLQKRVLK